MIIKVNEVLEKECLRLTKKHKKIRTIFLCLFEIHKSYAAYFDNHQIYCCM